jgi:Fe-S-cluster containining protein
MIVVDWKCRIGCGECCGCFSLPKALVEKYADRFQFAFAEVVDFPPDEKFCFTDDLKCVFLDRETKRCVVYDERPQVCRDYGHVPRLPCPYIKPNGLARRPAKVRRAQRQINNEVDAKWSW